MGSYIFSLAYRRGYSSHYLVVTIVGRPAAHTALPLSHFVCVRVDMHGHVHRFCLVFFLAHLL